jgi:hypothetical protein
LQLSAGPGGWSSRATNTGAGSLRASIVFQFSAARQRAGGVSPLFLDPPRSACASRLTSACSHDQFSRLGPIPMQ